VDEVARALVRATERGLAPSMFANKITYKGFLDPVAPLAHFSNFQIRSLLGLHVFRQLPIGSMTMEHLGAWWAGGLAAVVAGWLAGWWRWWR
jgi:hypothetical protein